MFLSFRFLTFIAFILPCLLITVLAIFSPDISAGKGGFTRKYSKEKVRLISSRKLPAENMYIAGIRGSEIVLASSVDAHSVFVVNFLLSRAHILTMNNAQFGLPAFGVSTKVDSTYIFQLESATPSVLRGDSVGSKFTSLILVDRFISDLLPLSLSSFLLKSYDTSLRQDILCKSINDSLSSKRYVFKTVGDGRFSVDGVLLSDRSKKNIVYLYYYRNQFIDLDSNLNVKYLGRTVDTITTPKIHLSAIQSENSLTFSGLPPLVNKRACIDNDHLFVLSVIPADNELKRLRSNSVIDAYRLGTGRYEESFYIPNIDGSLCTGFQCKGELIFATYKDAVAVFAISAS